MPKIVFPEGKQFAFTIVDDTDGATRENISPIYDLLTRLGYRTTKTIWVNPPKDSYLGDDLQKKEYLEYILDLQKRGFEIALHGIGSGPFERSDYIAGFQFLDQVGINPKMHINHSKNASNLYWGYKRFVFPFKFLFRFSKRQKTYSGEETSSNFFWGDLAKKRIKYIRNLTFNAINTLANDPEMPYRIRSKDRFSNFWFSSSDGHTIEEFNQLLERGNIEKLKKSNGCCIVYTHFASGFTNSKNEINSEFAEKLEYLSRQNGWFVPASTLLDHLLTQKKNNDNDFASYRYLLKLNLFWFANRLVKRFKYRR